MDFILDIGNTSAKAYAYDHHKVVDELHFDKYNTFMLDLFCKRHEFGKGILSSVVNLPEEMTKAISGLPFKMMRLESGRTPIPIKNLYATPETLGADRLAASVGAYVKGKGHDLLIIDIGTCVTIDFVNAAGEYLGGNISPGVSMRLKALKAFTDKLPLIDRHGEVRELGCDTPTAIRSGAIYGMEYEIKGYISKFSSKYPNLFIYLTGGVQLDLHISKKSSIFADRYLVPDGLEAILNMNMKDE